MTSLLIFLSGVATGMILLGVALLAIFEVKARSDDKASDSEHTDL